MLGERGFLVKEDFYEKVHRCKVIKENLKDNDELMKVTFKVKDDLETFHIFCDKSAKETSRVKFLSYEKFPDGIFIVHNKDGSIDCHICELKRNPTNNLKNLSLQLFCGYLHCKLFLTTLELNDKDINYNYNVFMIKGYDKEEDYRRLPNTPMKISPGKKIIKESDYDDWKNNRVRLEENGVELLDVSVNKYTLREIEDTDDLIKEFHYTLAI
ncbi:hypothetical protein [Virgibacillus sp. Bac330]|uniref:hypothetical protein n=1 Tax=Virgibacillus sp. Bac330 TaxID=2419841 RepID=UPI000EF4EC0C|nr:hypothetical protein [Virgibacillus sp. Bac330]